MTQKDEYTVDGTMLFNPSRSHGTVYGGGSDEAKWVQDGIHYRGDRKPVGYVEPTVEQKAIKPKQ